MSFMSEQEEEESHWVNRWRWSFRLQFVFIKASHTETTPPETPRLCVLFKVFMSTSHLGFFNFSPVCSHWRRYIKQLKWFQCRHNDLIFHQSDLTQCDPMRASAASWETWTCPAGFRLCPDRWIFFSSFCSNSDYLEHLHITGGRGVGGRESEAAANQKVLSFCLRHEEQEDFDCLCCAEEELLKPQSEPSLLCGIGLDEH